MNNGILDDYQRYLSIKGIRTRSAYLVTLNEFFDFIGQYGFDYREVTPGLIEDYRSGLLSVGLGRGTINNKINRIRGFYRFCVKRRLIPSNPLTGIAPLRTGRTIPKNILSVPEMGRLLDNFGLKSLNDIMLKTVAEILYGSALRISEVESLKLEDINYPAGVFIITDHKNDGRRRRCPASEVSLRLLDSYVKTVRGRLVPRCDRETGYLFPRKRKPSLRCMLNRKLKNECLRLGLPVITSHAFRHSAATHMLRMGAGIRQVQALLGHVRIATTQMYTRVVKEDLKEVVHACHPRERRD